MVQVAKVVYICNAVQTNMRIEKLSYGSGAEFLKAGDAGTCPCNIFYDCQTQNCNHKQVFYLIFTVPSFNIFFYFLLKFAKFMFLLHSFVGRGDARRVDLLFHPFVAYLVYNC